MRCVTSCPALRNDNSSPGARPLARAVTTMERLRCMHLIVYQRRCVFCRKSMGFNSRARWFDCILLPLRIGDVQAEVDTNTAKLHLILDLDNTLIHSALSNVLRDSDFLKRDYFRVGHHVTKLRPFVREFLREASTMFEMSIYTLANREYAWRIAELIDPFRLYFGDRVISQEDCTVERCKSLDIVPASPSRVVIVDDKKKVWPNDGANVIEIEPYHYFSTKGKVGKEDEGRALLALLKRLRRIHRSYSAMGCGFFGKKDVRVLLNIIQD